jgi:hypothetical protein
MQSQLHSSVSLDTTLHPPQGLGKVPECLVHGPVIQVEPDRASAVRRDLDELAWPAAGKP